jgi:hypothetical protein
MKYSKPKIAVCVKAIRAIQGDKFDPLNVDHINASYPKTTMAYQADE